MPFRDADWRRRHSRGRLCHTAQLPILKVKTNPTSIGSTTAAAGVAPQD
ncbi:MAG TPA: hypothetical protein VJ783_05815 [Pirellulales bacterium]|nr:hypothetical protein [Pirellulales bacterium]